MVGTNAPTTRETADRETLVMQSIIDAHGQWEIENRNRKQGDGQLWQDGHVRLLARAAIIATDHIGEKVTADHAELTRSIESPFNACCNRDGCKTLLSEIAALRARHETILAGECPCCVLTRAECADAIAEIEIGRTQAERQRDELRKALERIADDVIPEIAPSIASQALANQGADQWPTIARSSNVWRLALSLVAPNCRDGRNCAQKPPQPSAI